MKLVVATPMRVVLSADDVRHVRAEDATGAFGILPGHADLLSVLAVSVIAWKRRDGHESYIAVRGGVLRVRGGRLVEVVTREAVEGDDLRRLETEVIARFLREAEEAATERAGETKMQLAVIRSLYEYARGARGGPAGPGHLRAGAESRVPPR